MRKNIKFKKSAALFISVALIASSCGVQNVPPTTSQNAPAGSTQGSLRKSLGKELNGKKIINSLSVFVEPSDTVGDFMKEKISNNPSMNSALAQLGITGGALNALDWSNGRQDTHDNSNAIDDDFTVEVYVPLKSDPKIVFYYQARYMGHYQESWYNTYNYKMTAVRADSSNGTLRTSLWDIYAGDISTWVVTSNQTQLQGLSTYEAIPDQPGKYIIGEDIGVSINDRSPMYAMKPINTSNLSSQSIIVTPVDGNNPPPSGTPTCDDPEGNGGLSGQSILVCPVEPAPDRSDPIFVSKPNCTSQASDVEAARNNYYGYSATSAGFVYGIFAAPILPVQIGAGALWLGSLFLARGAGMSLKAAEQRLNDCLYPPKQAFNGPQQWPLHS